MVQEQDGNCIVANWGCESDGMGESSFQLSILQRSASLLRMLLQDGVIDLELASSVIALDPGLTYGTLQLANRDLRDDCDRIWQLPPAVITAGRDALCQLLESSVQIGCIGSSRRGQLFKLTSDAVSRACVAYFLARELGSCHPRKCFLAGLMLEFPVMVRLSCPARLTSPAMLVPDMCHSLPAVIVKAILARQAREKSHGEGIVALALLADEILPAPPGPGAEAWLEELSGGPLWRPWAGISQVQRSRLLKQSRQLTTWVAENLYVMNPWHFMARLERSKAWE